MRIDVVTIFPAYLEPLRLSLPGKAQASGLLDLEVHDLRQWTHDRHRTVDDTPYGGGAGMPMKPRNIAKISTGSTISPTVKRESIQSRVNRRTGPRSRAGR
jgi:tRNA (guanine37-N1)-methyltransferase